MTNQITNLLDFYARPGMMTEVGQNSDLLVGLPTEIGALCKVVQQNLIHVFWAERYGRTLSNEEKATLNIRTMSRKLELMRQVDGQPLAAARPLEKRQVGNCRDFSLLLAAILRHQGRPARARCGFGAYFIPGHFEDHWVCEYWNPEQDRWILVDAQLDDFQRKALKITFDPLDVPRNQFVIAGQGWQMCREGRAKPEQFGIFDMHGWWFIFGDVVRDFLSLNKIEILPWDYEVGFFNHRLEDPFPQDQAEIALYDKIAALTVAGNEAFQEIRQIYSEDARWRVPESWPIV
jgi:Transglutaminase-like superfamily